MQQFFDQGLFSFYLKKLRKPHVCISDEKIRRLTRRCLEEGFNAFKLKVASHSMYKKN